MDNIVFVDNLPVQLSAADLKAHFAKYGEVRSVEIVSDRVATRARPIGLVTMRDQSDADRAIRALNGSFLLDRALVVGWMGGRVLPARTEPHVRVPSPPNVQRTHGNPAERGRAETFGRGEDESGSQPRKKGHAERPIPPVRMLQQFRERTHMTYELECSGAPLVIRIFFPKADSTPEWRVEAATSVGSKVAAASAPSRAEALATIAREWNARDGGGAPDVDWVAVTTVMTTVRAI